MLSHLRSKLTSSHRKSNYKCKLLQKVQEEILLILTPFNSRPTVGLRRRRGRVLHSVRVEVEVQTQEAMFCLSRELE